MPDQMPANQDAQAAIEFIKSAIANGQLATLPLDVLKSIVDSIQAAMEAAGPQSTFSERRTCPMAAAAMLKVRLAQSQATLNRLGEMINRENERIVGEHFATFSEKVQKQLGDKDTYVDKFRKLSAAGLVDVNSYVGKK